MLMQGDCLHLMKDIPSQSVDMILCDPPYGTTDCRWDSIIPLEEMWEQYRRIAKPNAAIVIMGSQPFTSKLIMSNPKAFKHSWVWNKKIAGNFATAKYAPMKIHEDVNVFCYGKVPYSPIMVKRDSPIKMGSNKCASNSARLAGGFKNEYEGKVYQEKYPVSILEYPRERGLHPTQKPVALCEYLIRTYTNEGDTVLDNCMGSGTVGVACKNTGRKFIGIENDPVYFAIAEKRINEHSSEYSDILPTTE